MRYSFLLRWTEFRYRITAAALGALAITGCAEAGTETGAKEQPGGPEAASAADRGAALSRAFPAQRDRVLGAGALPMAAVRGGFQGAPHDAPFRSVRVSLPAQARDAAHVLAGDLDIRVREEGVSGQGTIVERAVAYERAGGTSFWTANASGAEEWLHLSAEAVSASRPVAAWEIEGAAAEARNGAVALLDSQGVARVWVTAPEAYGRDGRAIQVRLSVTGHRIELSVDAEGEEILVDPGWAAAAPMGTGRAGHAMQTLANGRVLAAGGLGLGGGNITFLSSAELYDPSFNTWKTLPSMSANRYLASIALLPSGKVLVAGGSDMNAGIASGELFDPSTNTWSSGGTFTTGRGLMAFTTLQNGKLLFAGGYSPSGFLADVSIYDPATNTWEAGPSMSSQRADPGIWTLPSGKVLVAGGSTGNIQSPVMVATTEIYDPGTNSWSAGPPMATARYAFAYGTLSNGKLIAAGGIGNPDPISAVELYDPALGTWSSAPPLSTARGVPIGLNLLDGTFLVTGGAAGTAMNSTPLDSAEIYSPATNAWTPAGKMSEARWVAAATRLQNGEVLVTGGVSSQQIAMVSATADRYSYNIDGGKPCNVAGDCLTGFCTDGVCCVVAACPAPADSCHVQGTCQAGTGFCSNPAQPDSTPCDDGNACTQMDACQAGACTGSNPIACKAQDACHDAGTCDPQTGMCDNPAKQNGAACDDGNPCTENDACQAGACAGSMMACKAKDECHVAGTCDPKTGTCDSPEKIDGVPCTGGTCESGACVKDMGTGGTGGSGGSGGAGGGGEAGSGGSGASAGAGGSGGKKGGCGCRMDGGETGSFPAGALGLGLAALLIARRRKLAQ